MCLCVCVRVRACVCVCVCFRIKRKPIDLHIEGNILGENASSVS